MKITGIIILSFGILSTLGAIVATINGHGTNFSGIGFIVLGAYLLSRAKKKEEERKKKNGKTGLPI